MAVGPDGPVHTLITELHLYYLGTSIVVSTSSGYILLHNN